MTVVLDREEREPQPTSSEATRVSGHAAPSARRRDIQALRAVAIGGVLVNHLAPHRLTGGYIGVDIFFVISGYLITGIIARGIVGGRFRLSQFWNRRVRRLMPASFLAILGTTLAMLVWVPSALWRQFSEEAVASTLYVENWYLAAAGSDYFREDIPVSPFRHFWSLSVEEQYYVAIPILMVLLLLALRRSARRFTIALPLVLAGAGIASFLAAAGGVANAGIDVFYPTTTRAWQFALGGIVATAPAVLRELGASARIPDWLRAGSVWIAWIVLMGSLAVFDAQTPHPSWPTLVPTLATAVVLGMGSTALRWDSVRPAGLRPVQWLGDVSYSLYLWHWPVIIVSGYAFSEAPRVPLVIAQLAVSLALAASSYAWVERRYLDPRRDHLFTPRRAVAMLVVGTLCVLTVPSAILVQAKVVEAKAIAAVEELIKDQPACLGADAAARPDECAGTLYEALVPDQAVANAGARLVRDRLEGEGCFLSWRDEGYASCHLVGGDGTGPRVLMVGDSHAEQLTNLALELADAYDWDLTVAFRNSCPYTFAVRTSFGPAVADLCAEWQQAIADDLGTGDYDLLLTSQLSGVTWKRFDYPSRRAAGVDGLVAAWQVAVDSGARVLAIADNPHAVDGVQECVAEHGLGARRRCTLPREEALQFDPQLRAARAFTKDQVAVIDLTDDYCGEVLCRSVVGGVLVYRDSGHLTRLWASTLAPQVIDRAPAGFLSGT
ncbi:acyltransferase family protein [Demequina soli]|uniref:acyltransferase family protein n=1 Tax=Demequina soli TaxID=1638987 RepID=UPI0014724BC2|nr:acyltransferase family protein [Demequina soli]